MPSFRGYLKTLRYEGPVKVSHDFKPVRSKLLKGMMDFFNDQVTNRKEE